MSKHHCPKCKWLILCDIICPASSILKFEEAAKKLSKHHCPHRNRASKVYPLPQIRNLSKAEKIRVQGIPQKIEKIRTGERMKILIGRRGPSLLSDLVQRFTLRDRKLF